MQIRKMTMADYDPVYACWKACPEMEMYDNDDSPEGVARFLRYNPETALVAEEAGRILGVVMAGCDGRRGYIYHAAVLPECRGRGIGTRLVEQALEKLRALKISKVGLLVFADNHNGNQFWEKLGFHERPDLTYRSCVLMKLTRL